MSRREQRYDRRRARPLRALWTGISAGVLALVAGLAAVAVVVPLIAGATPLTVLTRSMQPTLPPGTLIVVRPTPVDEIEIGDVMTYQIESGRPEVVTHRVIEVRANSDGSRAFIAKGDNNDAADPEPVIAAQVRGTVWYSIPLIGWVSTTLVGQNRSWIVPVAAGALLLYAAIMLMLGIRDRARRRSRAISDAAAEDTVDDTAPA